MAKFMVFFKIIYHSKTIGLVLGAIHSYVSPADLELEQFLIYSLIRNYRIHVSK